MISTSSYIFDAFALGCRWLPGLSQGLAGFVRSITGFSSELAGLSDRSQAYPVTLLGPTDSLRAYPVILPGFARRSQSYPSGCAVDQPVLVVDPARPIAAQISFERFGFANTLWPNDSSIIKHS